MIIIVKKGNVAVIILIFLLSIMLYSLNVSENNALTVSLGNNNQKTVLIDPGHGGEDPGAVSDYSGVKEKDLNLNIALKLKNLLEKENIKVLMTREEDKLYYSPGTGNVVKKRSQDLIRRKKMMDTAGADIAVSIHLNKFQQTKYYGAQTFYPPNCSEGKKLAEYIQDALRQQLNPENKREALVKSDPIIILKNLKTTTVIVECGFLSNAAEEERLRNEEYRNKLARAIQYGILKYFESE